jgi:hypothetical protein
MNTLRCLISVIFVVLISACTSLPQKNTVELPLLTAWYEGQPVYYITTDVSDQAMAAQMQANYAPRLTDAIPHYPKPPYVKTVLERVYAFPNGEQTTNIFASIPKPLGSASQDPSYSPVWLMYVVSWVDKDKSKELRSESDIFDAEAAGLVTIERTNVVVNCPIVSLDGQHFLSTQ